MKNFEYVIIDIETTGLDKESSSIIEVGALLISNNNIKDRFSSFVSYDGVLSEEVKRITGIDDKMLEDAPSVKEVISKLNKFVGKRPVVAHNGLDFDFPILKRYGFKASEKYDSMDFAFFVLPINKDGHSIKELAKHFDVREAPHRALGDCEVLFQLIYKLQEKYQKKNKLKKEALKYIADNIGWWWSSFLLGEGKKHNISNLVPKYVSEEKKRDKVSDLELSGLFNLNQGDYSEDRPEQKRMANLVFNAFNNKKHIVIEAGTGTGKSKAYLVPSFLFALRNRVPVIISTYTKLLQDQLFDKEIPHIRKILGRDLKVTILKGKKNYICLQRFNSFSSEIESNLSQRTLEIGKKSDTKISDRLAYLLLSSWILETDKGYWDEIPYWFKVRISKGIEGNICNIDELCTKDTCNLHKEQKCFLAKARAKAKDADIIIANHALTLLEISNEEFVDEYGDKKSRYVHTIFPEGAKFVVFDEAHYLEKAATSAIERTISEDAFHYLIQQIKRIPNFNLKDKEKTITTSVDNLFNKTLPQVMRKSKEGYSNDILFKSLVKVARKEVNVNLENIKLALLEIRKDIDNGIEKAKDDKFLIISRKTIISLIESINIFLSKDDRYIKYIERDRDDIRIKIVPLSIAEYLREYVFNIFSSVVLTSATLTVDKKFNFFAKRCGTLEIKQDKIDYCLLKSSFDYKKQVKFFVPSGITYTREKTEEHLEKSIDFLEKAIIASNGGSLVLCTSYKQIDRIYDSLIVELSKNNINLLKQSDGHSSRSIIKTFEEDINSVLIGTETFWQGIDVPGKSLRSLFILKIPHDAPSSVTESRRELYNNPYVDYSAPLAAIKLKQGFGRLIRKSTDYGVAVLLDDNFMSKTMFINSLPDGVDVEKKSIEEILEELRLI